MNTANKYKIAEAMKRRTDIAFDLADQAEENYWCTSDQAAMQALVYFSKVAYGLQDARATLLFRRKADDENQEVYED